MLPAQGGGPAQLRQSRGVEVPRIPFTPRVPLKVLQQMLVGYDTVRAERLLSGFAYEFYSDALVWTAQHIILARLIWGWFHVCFWTIFIINESQDSCAASLRNFPRMCSMLNVPLRPDKTV